MKERDNLDKDIIHELPDGDKKILRKKRGYDRKYYETHKAGIIQKQRGNAEKHREYNKKHYNDNIEKEHQRWKDREYEKSEKRRAYKREYNRRYYLLKKAEMVS
jgi:hypothetical protein